MSFSRKRSDTPTAATPTRRIDSFIRMTVAEIAYSAREKMPFFWQQNNYGSTDNTVETEEARASLRRAK